MRLSVEQMYPNYYLRLTVPQREFEYNVKPKIPYFNLILCERINYFQESISKLKIALPTIISSIYMYSTNKCTIYLEKVRTHRNLGFWTTKIWVNLAQFLFWAKISWFPRMEETINVIRYTPTSVIINTSLHLQLFF